MSVGDPQRWLDWAREIQAISQTGLFFCHNDFDQIRYRRMLEIAAEILSEYTGVSRERLQEIYLRENGYATPKVDVRAAVFRDNQILLVREKTDGLWSLPGGYADVNELPAAMVEREVLEESGFQVRVCRLIGVYEANRGREPVDVYYCYKLLFLCEIVGGEARTSNETTDVGFFPQQELPPLSLHRTPERVIADAFKWDVDPDRIAVFE